MFTKIFKIKWISLLCLMFITTNSYAQSSPYFFSLSPDIISPLVVTYGSTALFSYKFSVTGGTSDYTFSSNPAFIDQYSTIAFSFLKNKPPAPSGNGASLFSWVRTAGTIPPSYVSRTTPPLDSVITWTGTSRDTTMYLTIPGDPSGHSRYNIIFANSTITDYSTAVESNIGSGAQYTAPINPEISPLTLSLVTELYTYSNPPIITPIHLVSFTGAVQGCTMAVLNWQTASEQNSSYYSIEASTNGIAFETIGKVFSKNLITGSTYSFKGSIENNQNIFRLKCIDLDESYTYSDVIKVNSDCTVTDNIEVSPNPFYNSFIVSGMANGSKTIQIIDMLGHTISNIISSNTTQVINAQNFAAGTYTIKIVNANGSFNNKKIVK